MRKELEMVIEKDAVERLRAQRETLSRKGRIEGHQDGRAWAMHRGTYEQIERISSTVERAKELGMSALDCLEEDHPDLVYGDHLPDWEDGKQTLDCRTGAERDAYDEGFLVGVAQLWGQIATEVE